MLSKLKAHNPRLISMKSFLIHVCFVLFCLSLQAQDHINPNVQWRFIKSDSITLFNNQSFTMEFPANKKYDYFFNLNHGLDSTQTLITVYDMQMGVVSRFVDSTMSTSAISYFNVEDNSTYKVYVSISSAKKENEAEIKALFSLVRRLKV
jgi:hypothetical protein